MKKRVLILDSPKFIGKKIKVAGWVFSRRDHGKLIFLDLKDRSGILQMVILPQKLKNERKIKKIKEGWIIEAIGEIKKRPKANINPEIETGEVEMEVEKIEIIAKPTGKLPFEVGKKEPKLKLETLFKYRPLSLRLERQRAIFKVFETVIQSYAEVMRKMGFVEIKSPKIIGAASEGGANFFTLDYFGKKAYLAQSPQFYKQICVGAFERVFEIGPVFRKEPHFTTRHLNEYISLDAEMGFISGMEEIMDTLEKAIKYIFKQIEKKNKKELDYFSAKLPDLSKKIPRIKLQEIKKIIKEKYGYKIPEDTDIDPEGERLAGKYAKEKWGSEFIFLTHYPTSKRPFYTMPDPKNPEETLGFDLLFRGLEIVTGSQRIHDYKMLKENIKKWGLDPKDFSFYLQAFKYGMPPHGGWAIGAERVVYKLLGLSSVKEASLFPRDVKRLVP